MHRTLRLGSLLVLSLVMNPPAVAHKVVTSVWADGDDIEGEIGFSSGDMAPQGTRVEVLGPDGGALGEVFTDADGLFRFTPTEAVAHTFRANLGAGHVAEAVLAADELPAGLSRNTVTQAPESAASNTESLAPPTTVATKTELEALIAEALRRELKPLRKELAAYREKNDLQSILGGLGYICGIFGLAFFIYARRGKTRQ